MDLVKHCELDASAPDELMSLDVVDDEVLEGGVDTIRGDVMRWGTGCEAGEDVEG